MATNGELVALGQRVFLGNMRPAPIVLTRGEGTWVFDVEGRRYLDLSGGIAVLSVGHAHPKLAAAIAEQAARLIHVSNLFFNDRAIELASEITRRTGFARAFFCNSGTEAIEGLLKLGRRYHFEQGNKERTELVATHGSFHGRSMGSLSVTGQAKYHEGMGPLVGDVRFVPYGDIDALRATVSVKTAAIILEPIQAEGGIIVADPAYLKAVRELCDESGALLLFDEVQTGYGRTGRFLAREWSGVWPDACALAKGIGGGFPLGAIVTSEKLSHGLPPGSHGTTYGGNPLACAAGLAILAIFDEERLIANAEQMGVHLAKRLDALVLDSGISAASGRRGLGLLQGLVLADGVDPMSIVARLREAGVLLSLAGGRVLRIAPPLNVSRDELDHGVDAIASVLSVASVSKGAS